MKEITIKVPEGKNAEWVNGVLTLVEERVIDNRPVTERIKTVADAINELGGENTLVKEYMSVLNADVDLSADILATLRIRIIAAALNEGWKPKFVEDEYRYYPWIDFYTQEELDKMDEDDKKDIRVLGRSGYSAGAYAGVAYSYARYASSNSSALSGGRLCFKNRDLAEYAGKQFLEEYMQIILCE